MIKRNFGQNKERDLRVNERIHIREVRVTDAEGKQLGIMPTKVALEMAYEKHLDLVEIAPNARPPVCRIMNYGKYKYEKQKKEKEARQKSKVIAMKEVKLRTRIEDNDFETKLRHAIRFLESGAQVRVVIMFRGRELAYPELGKELLDRVAGRVADIAKVEQESKIEGRDMTMVLAPSIKKSAA